MKRFSTSPGFKKVEEARRTGEYNPSSWWLREGAKIAQDLLLGNVAFELVGLENLLIAAKDSAEKGRGLIVASDHLNNVSTSATVALVAQLLNPKVSVASTNLAIWHQRIPYKIIGMDSIYPVPYRYAEGFDGNEDHKKPSRFESGYYDELVEDIRRGRSVVAAAHNPVVSHGSENTGKLPEKPGKLVPHLALASGSPILPVLIQVEGQQEKLWQLNDNTLHPGWMLREKAVRVTVSKPIMPTDSEIDNYHEILQGLKTDSVEVAENEQHEVLQRLGGEVLEAMQNSYDEEFAKSL